MKKFYCFIFCVVIFRARVDSHKIQKIRMNVDSEVDTFISNIEPIISYNKSNYGEDYEKLCKAKNVSYHVLYDILNAIQDINEENNPNEAMKRAKDGIQDIINSSKNLDLNFYFPENIKYEGLKYNYDSEINLILNFILFNAKTKAEAANKAADIAETNAAAISANIDNDSLVKFQILTKIAADAEAKYASIAEHMLSILYSFEFKNKDLAKIKNQIKNANEKAHKAIKDFSISKDYDSIITEATKKFASILSASKSSVLYIDSAPFIKKISSSLYKNSLYIEKIPDILKGTIDINNAKQNYNLYLTILENISLKIKDDKLLPDVLKAYKNIDKAYDSINKAYIALNNVFLIIDKSSADDSNINQAWTALDNAIQNMKSKIENMKSKMENSFKSMKIFLIKDDDTIKNMYDKFRDLMFTIYYAIKDDPNSLDIANLLNEAKIEIKNLIENLIDSMIKFKSNNDIIVSDFINARINMIRNIFLFTVKLQYEFASSAYDIIANEIKSNRQASKQSVDLIRILFNGMSINIKLAEFYLEITKVINDTLKKSVKNIRINNDNNDIDAEKIQALFDKIKNIEDNIKDIKIPLDKESTLVISI